LPADYAWADPDPALMAPAVPIIFVHEGTDAKEWGRLKQFWTEEKLPPGANRAAAVVGLPALQAAATTGAPADRVARIKVPLGVDAPPASAPAATPPTLDKWQLGKQLFSDDGWLPPAGGRKEACVPCHNPDSGYTETSFARLNAPTLINCVYNTH